MWSRDRPLHVHRSLCPKTADQRDLFDRSIQVVSSSVLESLFLSGAGPHPRAACRGLASLGISQSTARTRPRVPSPRVRVPCPMSSSFPSLLDLLPLREQR